MEHTYTIIKPFSAHSMGIDFYKGDILEVNTKPMMLGYKIEHGLKKATIYCNGFFYENFLLWHGSRIKEHKWNHI